MSSSGGWRLALDDADPGTVGAMLRERLPSTAAGDLTLAAVLRLDAPAAGGLVLGEDLGGVAGGLGVELGEGGAVLLRQQEDAGPGLDLGAAVPGWAFVVVWRRGKKIGGGWNGVTDVRGQVLRRPPEAPSRLVLGPFRGAVREIGLWRRALEPDELARLLDDLADRMPGPRLAWAGRPLAGPYPPAPGARHALVIAPSGAEPSLVDLASHRYRHHTRIAVHAGRVWAALSSGAVGEDAPGQMVAAASSADGGSSWSPPLAALSPQSPWRVPADPETAGYEPGSRVAYPRAFVRHAGRLWLVCAVDHVNALLELQGVALIAAECRPDGSLGPPARISAAPDAPLAGIEPIGFNPDLAGALAREADLGGHWGGSSPGNLRSAWTGWLEVEGGRFAEPATLALDGEGRRMLRLWRRISRGERRRLYVQRSEDGGASFGPLTRSSLPTSPGATAALRLADGRLALALNPLDHGLNRDPLALALFDAASGELRSLHAIRAAAAAGPVHPGWHKHGAVAYPGLAEDGGQLFVSYSLWKESVAVTRIPLQRL